MNEVLNTINLLIVVTGGFLTLLVTFVRPIRERIFRQRRDKAAEEVERESQRETHRCLIRDRILSSYFKHFEKEEIRQYEFENVMKLYEQYKKLGGNSFVTEVVAKIREWTIIK